MLNHAEQQMFEDLGITLKLITIDAIHWAENEVDANIEASMKNTGESMISILSSCHWQLIQFWLFYSSD